MTWQAYTFDADTARTGPMKLLAGSDFTIRHNAVGMWTAEALYSDSLWDRLEPGGALAMLRDGKRLLSGPYTAYGFTEPDTGDGPTRIVCEGVTDEIVLADAIVLPDPARGGTDQTTQSHWRMTGPAEDVLCALVDQQVGPAARADRRVRGLTVAASQGRGAVVSAAIRYGAPNLLAEAQVLARAGGVAFRIVRPANGGRRFEVHVPSDKAGRIRYGTEMGNVAGQRYRTGAPTVTYALAGGQGDLTARLQREATRTDAESLAWGRRIETYVDARDTDDVADLDDRAAKAVADGNPEQSYSFTPIDTDNARLFADVRLGDRVTVYVGPRGGRRVSQFADLVREIHGELGDDVDTFRAAVGSEGATTGHPMPDVDQLLKIRADLKRLEGSA